MNMKKRTYKLIVDFLLGALWIILTCYSFTGALLHEWLGVGSVVLLALHLFLNRKWIAGVTRRIFHTKFCITTVLYFCSILLFLSFITTIISGLLMSKVLLPNLNIGNHMVWKVLHVWASYISLILMGIHVGLHWKLILTHIRTLFHRDHATKIGRIIGNGLAVLIMIYGIKSSANMYLPTFQQTGNRSNGSSNEAGDTDENAQTITTTQEEVNKDTTTSSSSTSISEAPQDGESLDDFLDRLVCTGCGRHCPLSAPRCGTGEGQASEATAVYQNYQNGVKTESSDSSSASEEKSNSSSDTSSQAQDNNNTSGQSNVAKGGNAKGENNENDRNLPTPPDGNGKGERNGKFRGGPPSDSPNGNGESQNANGSQNETARGVPSKEHKSTNSSTAGMIAEKTSIMGLYIAGTYYILEVIDYKKKKKILETKALEEKTTL